MNILIYRYGSICEPDIVEAFQKMGLNVIEETTEIDQKGLLPSDQVKLVKQALDQYHPMFVFSINFFPSIADICQIYGTKYLCWTVDCPVPELFSRSVQHSTNRIFLFDRAQYEAIHPLNPDGVFYLPLAAATERFDKVIAEIKKSEKEKFSSDISFVGSLYIEKNPLRKMGDKLSEFTIGYIDGVVEASLKVMGYNFMEETITQEIVKDIKKADSNFYSPKDSLLDTDKFIVAHSYLGMEAAEKDRIRTLNTLAQYFNVDLYTRSDTSKLKNVHVHEGVKTLTEMPKIFHLSKINLNMTIKPIQTGLPLRIFDIMGCGGFCMTNFQAELPELFDIGVDLEAYSSLEELVDKCFYYLTHEDERVKIALNGYKKVKEYHGYVNRMVDMIRRVVE
ncbi:MAG: glycosyltransferase [Lachnospiraceae bacterium]|nr:glycosyltransferase [Lachnospiraceae bacterium]